MVMTGSTKGIVCMSPSCFQEHMPQYPQIEGHRNSDGGFDNGIF
jgi:hypothetical protein